MNTAELKALVGKVSGYAQGESLRFSCCPEPLPKGGLIELTGFGKSELMVKILAEQNQPAIWLSEIFNLNPFALWQRQVALKNIFFIEAKESLFWACSQVVQSRLYSSIIVDHPQWNLTQFRKLQLLAKKSDLLVFFLSKTPLNAWPIRLSLKVERGFWSQELQIHTLKRRDFLT